jgi:HPt (histidine-containing phosphotransfer) domain-containing protein
MKPSKEDSDLFDRNQALALVDGDESLFRELSGLFAQQWSGQLLAVREAIAENDSEALARGAHRLKGSAGAFGNGPAFDKAAEIESLARNGNLARACESLEALEREMRNLAAALLSYGEDEAGGRS